MKRVLGTGFDSLFSQTYNTSQESLNEEKSEVKTVKTSMVEPRKDQPRKNFDREQLQALSASIAEHGVLQPIIVTEGENGYYSIIAGERRWRAAKLANLAEIPVIIRKLSDIEVAEIALIENLQREDLNPIEEAIGYKTLMDRFSMTQDKVSERVGKSRSNIANMLRLLTLEDEIKELLVKNKLSTGHARALLSLEGGEKRVKLAQRIADEDMNVRQVEALVKETEIPKKKERKAEKISAYPDVEKQLSEKYGTKIRIKGSRKGKVEIEFYSVSDLTRLVDLLDR